MLGVIAMPWLFLECLAWCKFVSALFAHTYFRCIWLLWLADLCMGTDVCGMMLQNVGSCWWCCICYWYEEGNALHWFRWSMTGFWEWIVLILFAFPWMVMAYWTWCCSDTGFVVKLRTSYGLLLASSGLFIDIGLLNHWVLILLLLCYQIWR